MRHTVSAAFFLLTTCLSAAFSLERGASSISVRVRDPQGASVEAATVTLYRRDDRLRVTALTDRAGRYRFEQLAPGDYLVEAKAPGLARTEARSVRLEYGSEAELDISLELAAFEEQVVVTASGTAQTVDEVSKAITVVGEQEFDARDEFSIPEALRTVPGLRVQQLGGPGAMTSIKTRGLRNEHTAVLVDGVRLRDAASTQGDASAFMEVLIATDLERVEILRGSGSSLYGTHAVGGVIHIVSRDGGGRQRGSLLFERGSLDLFRGRAQWAGGLDGDRITYSAGLAHLNIADGVDGDDDARNTSVQGRVRFRFSPTATLSARIYSARGFLRLNEDPQAIGNLPPTGIIDARPLALRELLRYETGTPASGLDGGDANFIPSANDPDHSRDTRFFSTVLNFEQRPSETFGYSINYHRLVSDRTFADGPGGVSFEPQGPTRLEFDGRIHTLNARADFQWGRYQFITAGYELESESFLNRSLPDDPTASSTVDVSQRSNTFFIQDQVHFRDGALQLSGAFRTQLFSLDTPAFTPAGAAPYQGIDFEAPPNAYTGDGSIAYFLPDTGTKLRAHVGNGYRAPSLFERFGTFFGAFGYSVFGDPRLRPERSIAFDTGLEQDFAGNRLRTSVTFFYTRLQSVIVFDFSGAIDPATDPFGRFGGYRRVEGGMARGLELSATARPAPGIHLRLAYTYTDADIPTPGVEDLPQAFIIPQHQFSLVVTQHIGRDLYVNFDLTASDDYLAPVFDTGTFTSRTFRFDGILKADLGASYAIALSGAGNLRFFVKVDNLFDRTYFENGFRTPGRTGFGGVAFHF